MYEPLQQPGATSGFPSPAQDYTQKRLHISQLLITDPTNTHYFRARGEELNKFHIRDNNILIVDKSIRLYHGATVICHAEGTWMIREVLLHQQDVLLSDKQNNLINLRHTQTRYTLWGVITWTCHNLHK
ncbi:S24 family peptidase [Pedobacter sp. HMWF019]|uniref:S24 family peptidase n=1 Tax=Pedobacter sp. HMWF019 TaxID=2056856 RepID=UPI0011B23438|nr:S24 family peptidase [Pedobacter sp. HMWF019]